MGLNDTPMAERTHIAFFGKRNAGKSSLVNAVTNQSLAIVSEVKGTTTDPVYKTMEILPLGPVVIIDTPGLDDEGELGQLRIEKANEVLKKANIALIVIDANDNNFDVELDLISKLKQKNTPYIICINKIDTIRNLEEKKDFFVSKFNLENIIFVSAEEKTNIFELKEKIAYLIKDNFEENYIVKDLINQHDLVVLVIPIDESAPKGRIILPQQQVIRELLDANAYPLITKETDLEEIINKYKNDIKLVITDSQVFNYVSKIVPEDMPLTSFSILFSKYRGDINTQLESLKKIETLKDGDYILISEACTHHRQCNDIGTVKIPKILEKLTNKKFNFEWTSGGEFPNDLSKYKFVIHCGACMISFKAMKERISTSVSQNVPITNYGLFIAYATGILDRAIQVIIK